MRPLVPLIALVLCVAAAGCDKPEYPSETGSTGAGSQEHTGGGPAATGHPGDSASAAGGGTAADGSLALGTIKSTVPKDWTEKPAAGIGRLANYVLPRAAGDPADPQFIVFYFGDGSGGSLDDNLKRWKGMMKLPPGQDVEKVAKVKKVEKGGVKVTILDLSGTYKEKPFPMAEEFTERPNYRLVASMIENTRPGASGPYFTRMIGPARSVGAAMAGWDAFVASLKAD